MSKTRILAGAACLCMAVLGACGGSGSGPAATGAGTLSGSVAVGVAMTDARLRILDAAGNVVAGDVPVAADGTYPEIVLTGPAPYRIEACGHTGPNFDCLYSVAHEGGTVNVTPLTSALVLLASGSSPGALMDGPATGLGEAAVDAATLELQLGLAGVLASAGVSPAFDFIGGPLIAGSRSGYDFVLDAVGVTTGVDAAAFVQITPRLGSGNLYIEAGGDAVGEITSDAAAAGVPLPALEALFQNMTLAMAGPEACADPENGVRAHLASDARMNDDDGSVTGAENVADYLCGFFATGESGEDPMWGSRLLSPMLGRCDLSGGQARCRVSFTVQFPNGAIMNAGSGMGVVTEGGAWKFLGSFDKVDIFASATAQRTLRVDGDTPLADYYRALSFNIPALPGVSCARVTQPGAPGGAATIAYFKRHEETQRFLSLWLAADDSGSHSLDPAAGYTSGSDSTWLGLPPGADGDLMVRNFYRGGRSVEVALFGDAGCTTPLPVDGQSVFEVQVEGVPPVWSAMAALPWPQFSDGAINNLRNFALAADASGTLDASWTFPGGRVGLNGATFCIDMSCGDGSDGRVSDLSLTPDANSVAFAVNNGATPIDAGQTKLVALYGRTGDGMLVQGSFVSCPGTTAGEHCQ